MIPFPNPDLWSQQSGKSTGELDCQQPLGSLLLTLINRIVFPETNEQIRRYFLTNSGINGNKSLTVNLPASVHNMDLCACFWGGGFREKHSFRTWSVFVCLFSSLQHNDSHSVSCLLLLHFGDLPGQLLTGAELNGVLRSSLQLI